MSTTLQTRSCERALLTTGNFIYTSPYCDIMLSYFVHRFCRIATRKWSYSKMMFGFARSFMRDFSTWCTKQLPQASTGISCMQSIRYICRTLLDYEPHTNCSILIYCCCHFCNLLLVSLDPLKVNFLELLEYNFYSVTDALFCRLPRQQ